MINKGANKLLELIENSQRILVTSHISPDPDAICSALLVGNTLKHNFPANEVVVVLEEQPTRDLSFLTGYEQIKFQPLIQPLNEINPDLLIITDANNLERVSRSNAAEIRNYLVANKDKIKTAIIDHHEENDAEPVDAFINTKRPATAEEIYVTFFEQLGMKKPDGYAETTLLGIISDTQRHKFDHPGYRETYRIVTELRDAGASIEKLESKSENYNKNELEALAHLAGNITNSGKGYTFSFITDEFYQSWRAARRPDSDLKMACEDFVDRYIRNFESNQWGFLVSPEPMSGDDWWGVSLRAISGAKDVSAVARALGGGGHKPAAGAKIQANSVQEALEQVKEAIATTSP